jgi:hypothetical protein
MTVYELDMLIAWKKIGKRGSQAVHRQEGLIGQQHLWPEGTGC